MRQFNSCFNAWGWRQFSLVTSLATALFFSASPVQAGPHLVIDADTGAVLSAQDAGAPWYPASVTKLMTAYVTLKAVEEGRLAMNSPVRVSPLAKRQAPSKMGFAVGTPMTVETALYILMVKSANDIAVVLAEGVSGSVPAFANEMNTTARHLGMTGSHFVNPNGLPNPGQVTTARDLALLAQALLRDFPRYHYLFNTPAIQVGSRVMQNHNKLVGRYPGADGMKTGFICASGFNLVATARRSGQRLIAVVLGSTSAKDRALTAMKLLDEGFKTSVPRGRVTDIASQLHSTPVNMRPTVCGGKRPRPASEDEDVAEDIFSPSYDGADERYALFQTPQRATYSTGGSRSSLLRQQLAVAPVLLQVGPQQAFGPEPLRSSQVATRQRNLKPVPDVINPERGVIMAYRTEDQPVIQQLPPVQAGAIVPRKLPAVSPEQEPVAAGAVLGFAPRRDAASTPLELRPVTSEIDVQRAVPRPIQKPIR